MALPRFKDERSHCGEIWVRGRGERTRAAMGPCPHSSVCRLLSSDLSVTSRWNSSTLSQSRCHATGFRPRSECPSSSVGIHIPVLPRQMVGSHRTISGRRIPTLVNHLTQMVRHDRRLWVCSLINLLIQCKRVQIFPTPIPSSILGSYLQGTFRRLNNLRHPFLPMPAPSMAWALRHLQNPTHYFQKDLPVYLRVSAACKEEVP